MPNTPQYYMKCLKPGAPLGIPQPDITEFFFFLPLAQTVKITLWQEQESEIAIIPTYTRVCSV